MEKALVLGKMSHRVPINILEKFRAIEGVKEANLIFGPYDFYITIETRTKERLEDITIQIRSTDGVIDSLTCYVVSSRVQIDALNLDQN
jgi:DNA-binding Lrp family transcriptional regulator